jgi:phospholipid/cholesterol/gamma-HCH transport system permease protein
MPDHLSSLPETHEIRASDGTRVLEFTGAWTLRNLQQVFSKQEKKLPGYAASVDITWDLRKIDTLDTTGAVMLWRIWGKQRPAALLVRSEHEPLFAHLEAIPAAEALSRQRDWLAPISILGKDILALGDLMLGLVRLTGQLTLNVAHLWRHPSHIPWREISANLYRAGPQAMPITALVGFLVGIVFAYLSSQQLHSYGAEVLIINTLGISILREFGPVLTAVLVAGRTGSAITAQIGAMRAAQELDAMAVIGISQGVRLIFPIVAALTLALPLTVLWTDIVALIGGALAADAQMNVDMAYFFSHLPSEVPIANLWLGLAKSVVFGFLISLIACHFGLKIRPNTESMRLGTTNSVVTSIAAIMVVDAIFAVLFFDIGIK